MATLVVAVALAGAASVLNGVLRGSLERSATDQAEMRATSAAGRLSVAAAPALPLYGVTEPFTTITTPGEGSLSAVLDPDVQVLRAGTTGKAWAEEGYVVVAETVATKSGTLVIHGRASLEPAERALTALRTLLIFGIPALLILVAVLTWLFMSKALVPVSGITAKLADITARDLHQRVPVPSGRDEINALACTVNATLDRLETAVGHHKRFVADAAHELRSPIATLRTRLELGERAAPELARESLTDVARLQTLATDLLLLSRLDAGEPLRTQEVDLGQLATEETLRLKSALATKPTAAPGQPATEEALHLRLAAEPIAAPGQPGTEEALHHGPYRRDRGRAEDTGQPATGEATRPPIPIFLDIAPDVLVNASPAHLTRVITNLLSNALRHAESAITVRVTPDATLDIIDDGPGIPPEHRESIFDRFTRLDEARDRDAGGAGLGLAIARDIAHAHGGTLTVADTPETTLRLRLKPL
ncbi:sensor histidine kinase [Acrocarpospora pleiomorpha]|uniref:sensor histidine kinase n=1 Tax=Acrocarpospora pleiomorpha TaxID=90975 RepID=UPI00147918A3|nr:ATP-binding protein [Acrocarpospora pleiomorpha]